MSLLQDSASALSRQSLYVKFDPLVEKRKSLGTLADAVQMLLAVVQFI